VERTPQYFKHRRIRGENIVTKKELVELRQQLQTLKNKELKLEADLAIREYPEAEVALIKIALALFEFNKATHALKVSEKPDEITRKKLEVLANNLRYHENKIETFKTMLSDALQDGGVVSKYQKLNQKLDHAASAVDEACSQNSDDLFAASIDLDSVFSILSIAKKKFEKVT
tara:strand:- start:1061 stop:1579 length:519 start_codon:yes stop_codon:yes gene_type:complete